MSEHQHQEEMTSGSVVKMVVLSIVGFILAIVLLAKMADGFRGSPEVDEDTAEQQTMARIQPVGQLSIGEAPAPVGSRSGEAVYKSVCISCHDAGLAGAPKFGDAAAWAPRNSKGFALLVDHALHGFNGMPAKGGGADLTDDEIKRAVAFMANKAGASFVAPEVKAAADASPASAAAAAPASAPAATPVAAVAPASAAPAAASGKAVYESACIACHGAGVGGAPKFGDKAAWSARIAQGKDTLYKHALQGFQAKAMMAMPAKGGNASLPDADVKAAVDYMVDAAK